MLARRSNPLPKWTDGPRMARIGRMYAEQLQQNQPLSLHA